MSQNNVVNYYSIFMYLVRPDRRSQLVARLLQRSGLVYTHLAAATPVDFKMTSVDPNWLKPRGVQQRNMGLAWLRKHLDKEQQRVTADGVLYFADDDNTYDVRLFEEVRKLNVFS